MTRYFLVLRVLIVFGSAMCVFGENQHFKLAIGARSRLISTPYGALPDSQFSEQDSDSELRQTHPAHDGPWGDLEYYIFYLQHPNTEDNAELFSEQMYWCFPGHTEAEAIRKLEKIGISKSVLQKNSYMSIVSKELRIVPTGRLIMTLTPEIRSRLRMLLRRWPEKNPYYAYPIVIESGDPVSWYTGAGLTLQSAELIRSLCYSQKGIVVFSDVPYVLSRITDPEERNSFLRSLFRTRTLMLRLTINDDSRLNSIRNYWAIDNRRKEVLPIFNSIAETRGVEKLDVIHLLPSTARKRLYTFPEKDSKIYCHLACMEFYGIVPEWRDVHSDEWADVFKTYFIPAKGDLQFGDVVVLFNQETDEPIHSTVYIADDIFYTKNGFLSYRPWIFMFWSDIISLYGFNEGTYAKVYRLP
ncbi:hypothetical protein [Tichowtungia aerotolerans]|uniref:Uncharacterized protein n=1 Tax=Tichowtungia aerotolerans TaxID=2697043 RepID=A0A6P1M3F1_9BACT|nr:hypothetical protein [Tichowtungia aerotolerans]QHI68632.1 hypothetical protein GT409_03930 [Tichowtungia aerotolerans]